MLFKSWKAVSKALRGKKRLPHPVERNHLQQLVTLQNRLFVQTEQYQALQQDYQQQSHLLQSLEKKLAELQPLSPIAENHLNKWRY